MSNQRTYQTEAIIIKKVKLGEADRILTLYTPQLGKVRAVAKAVRRPRSKLAGHLELLTHSLVSLARGRSLDTIIGSQNINSFLSLKDDLWLTSCSLYAVELVDQFTADGVENNPLFRLLLETMQCLCQGGDSELTLRYFELHLLDEVGYCPQLRQCVVCHSTLEPITNSFCSSAGGVLCPDCSQSQPFALPLQVSVLKVMRFLQDNNYDNARRLKLAPGLSWEVAEVVRDYLKYLLEREVKSAAWLDAMRAQIDRTGISPLAANEG